MPALFAGVPLIPVVQSHKKRKFDTSNKKSAKRRRSAKDDEDRAARILQLESEVLESKKNYNNISELLDTITSEWSRTDESILAAIATCRIFSRLLAFGELEKQPNSTEKDAVVSLWLQKKYFNYKNDLCELLKRDKTASTALTLCMRMLKSEGKHLRTGKDYSFPVEFLSSIVRSLIDPICYESIRKEFSENFVEEFDDIRFYTFGVIEKILTNSDLEESSPSIANALEILAAVESVPETTEELEDFYVKAPQSKKHSLYSLAAHKKAAQGAWLALMRFEMSKERRKKILGLVGKFIAPWFVKPELLMDFLTDSYNSGGSTSLLALDGVFFLMQEKNLDYPAFYEKLYSLLDSGLLHSKHRSKFFRLLDTFLASTHLPAVLVASFIKKLARLTLFSPPSGIVAVVPWIYNLLKKHPTCTFMIHREIRGAEEGKIIQSEGMDDPFDENEKDPMKTKAIDSCLWEIVILQSHYHPNVATVAKIISEQFTKHAYNLEDFLDHSYGSMLEVELSKDVKKKPVVEYQIPKRVLICREEDTGNLLLRIWDF